MQEVFGLERLAQTMETMPDKIREAGAEILEAAGDSLLSTVRQRIGGTGRLAGAQDKVMGSKKGYVAVRARKNSQLDGYAAGYITNALEGGHRQTPGRYVPAIGARLREDRAPGKYMYEKTRDHELVQVAQEGARRMEQVMKNAVEGRDL